MTTRLHFVDPTEAMRRPHVLRKYGPGAGDRLPTRIRPTLLQTAVVLVGVPVLMAGWWFVWRGFLVDDRIHILVAILIPCVVGKLVRTTPLDGRSLPRTARSLAAHRVRSHGRATGRWFVHGRPVPAAPRRPPKPPARVYAPAFDEAEQ